MKYKMELFTRIKRATLVVSALLLGSLSVALAQNTVRVIAKGTSLTIRNGQQGPIAIDGITKDNNVDHTITVTEGQTVVITGGFASLRLSKGQATSIDLSQAPRLSTFHSVGVEVERINFTGANSLEEVIVRDARYLASVDLRGLSQLATLKLGNFDGNKTALNRHYQSIIVPQPNILKTVWLHETANGNFDFSNLPELKELVISGRTGYINIALPNSPKLVKFWMSKVDNNQTVTLDGHPLLAHVDITGPRYQRSIIVRNISPAATYFELNALNDWGSIQDLTNIDISGNKLPSLDKALTVFAAPNLKTINISGNRLSESTITELINRLPNQMGKEGVFSFAVEAESGEQNQFTQAHRDALAAKGWTVMSPSSVDEVELAEVNIYPSVTNDIVRVSGALEAQPIRVYAMNGTLVAEGQTIAGGEAQLSLAHLPRATYMVVSGATRARIIVR